jgi:hypothetical protein
MGKKGHASVHNQASLVKADIYRSAENSLARPGRKQATAPVDFDFHIFYL